MQSPDEAPGRRMAPLLVAELVLSEAAAAAITLTTNEPAYEVTLHVAIAIGFLLSYRAVVRKRDNFMLAGLVAVAAVVICGMSYVRAPMIVLLYPEEIVGMHESTVAALFGWLLVAWALLQSRRDCLFLPVVTGLAIFGLMGTLNLSADFMVAFIVYLFAMAYAWGYDRMLDVRVAAPSTGKQPSALLRLSRAQLSATALLVIVVLIASTGVGKLLYNLTPNLWEQWRLLYRSWNWTGAIFQGTFMFTDEIRLARGRVRLSDMVMLKVRSDRPALWRGRVYDRYTGNGWRRTTDAQYPWLRAADGTARVATYYAPQWARYKGKRLRQTFTLCNVTTRGIFAAAQPVAIRITALSPLGPIRRISVQQDVYGGLQSMPIMMPGSSYEVVSVVPNFTAQQLRAAGDNYPPQIVEPYITQYPLEVEVGLKGLVDQITADCLTPYDKVQAILRYLERNCLYTLSPPPTPPGRDPVVYFVRNSKRGACDLFASAAALMCRLAGVPARLATGFSEGTWDPDEEAFIVRGTDAHAWIEVYFPGYGWVPYDPHAAGDVESQGLLELLSYGQIALALSILLRWMLIAGGGILVFYLVLGNLVDLRTLWQVVRATRRLSGPWQKVAREQAAIKGALARFAHAGLDDVAAAFDDLYRLRYAPRTPSAAELNDLCRRLRHLRRRLRHLKS